MSPEKERAVGKCTKKCVKGADSLHTGSFFQHAHALAQDKLFREGVRCPKFIQKILTEIKISRVFFT